MFVPAAFIPALLFGAPGVIISEQAWPQPQQIFSGSAPPANNTEQDPNNSLDDNDAIMDVIADKFYSAVTRSTQKIMELAESLIYDCGHSQHTVYGGLRRAMNRFARADMLEQFYECATPGYSEVLLLSMFRGVTSDVLLYSCGGSAPGALSDMVLYKVTNCYCEPCKLYAWASLCMLVARGYMDEATYILRGFPDTPDITISHPTKDISRVSVVLGDKLHIYMSRELTIVITPALDEYITGLFAKY
jgi:hypothetical protein